MIENDPESSSSLCAQRNKAAKYKADRDITKEGVLHYLRVGKRLFLEDAACIQDEFPNLPIFEMKVFHSEEWAPFKAAILAAEADPESVLPPRKDLPVRHLCLVPGSLLPIEET